MLEFEMSNFLFDIQACGKSYKLKNGVHKPTSKKYDQTSRDIS